MDVAAERDPCRLVQLADGAAPADICRILDRLLALPAPGRDVLKAVRKPVRRLAERHEDRGVNAKASEVRAYWAAHDDGAGDDGDVDLACTPRRSRPAAPAETPATAPREAPPRRDDDAAAGRSHDAGKSYDEKKEEKKDRIMAMMDAALASTARVARGAWPDLALCVKPEWLEKILRGVKTVELRGTISKKGGTRFGLICSGTGLVWGECTFVECRGPLTKDELLELQPRHHVHARDDGEPDTADELRARVKYRNCYAWVIKDAVVYETGIAYEHPRGAIGWIDLTKSVADHPRFRARSPPPPKPDGPPQLSPPKKERPPGAEMSPPKKPKPGGSSHKGAPRRRRCNACDGCTAPNCGECGNCKNMVQFGGTGARKAACANRRCVAIDPARGAGAPPRAEPEAPVPPEDDAPEAPVSPGDDAPPPPPLSRRVWI